MPHRPRRPCSYPGCPRLTEGRFCEEHAREEAKRYEKYERNPTVRKRYGKTWRVVRAAYVLSHPLCEECLKRGVYKPVEQVHHIIPLSEGGTNEADNLMSLCRACHARIHAERGDRFGRYGACLSLIVNFL